MQQDSYPLLMKMLMITAVIGLAVSFGDLYLYHIALGLVLLRSMFVRSPGTLFSRFQPPSSYHHFFGFMVIWFCLGLLWSWERWYTLNYLKYIACGIPLSIAILKYSSGSLQRFEQLIAAAVPFFFADIVAGLLESFSSFRLPISPMATGSEFWQKRAFAYSTDSIRYMLSSPTGFHWNPNNFAAVMLMLLPFALFHRRISLRAAGVAVVGVLVLYAGSRGGIATMAVILFTAPAYLHWRSWVFAAAAVLALGSYCVLGGVLDGLSTGHGRLGEVAGTVSAVQKYVSPEQTEDIGSIGVRRQLLRNGMDALHESYGLGVGGGVDRWVQEQFAWSVKGRSAMHNFWAELLVSGGYPFFLVLIVWYARLVYELFQFAHRFGVSHPLGYYSAALSLAMIGFVPGAVTASTTIYMLPMYILWGLAVAMVNICRNAAWQANTLPSQRTANPTGLRLPRRAA